MATQQRLLVAFALLFLASGVVARVHLPTSDELYVSLLPKSSHGERSVCAVMTYGCNTRGQFCGTNYTSQGTYQAVCVNVPSDMCNTTSGVCVANPYSLPAGSPCNSTVGATSYCAAPLKCVNSQCNNDGYPGESCTHDYDCVYNNGGNNNYTTSCVMGKCYGLQLGEACNEGTCVSPLTCSGHTMTCSQPSGTVGAPCYSNDDCTANLHCYANNCTTFVQKGDFCDNGRNYCAAPYSCTIAAGANNGTCQEMYAGNKGDACTSSSQCGDNLYCNSTLRVCVMGVQFSQSSKRLCNETDQCESYETCTCDGSGENRCYVSPSYVGNPNGANKAYNDYESCAGQCIRTDESCLQTSCKPALCNYLNVFLGELYETELQTIDGYPQCIINYVLDSLYTEYRELGYDCTAPTLTSTTAHANGSSSIKFSTSSYLVVLLLVFAQFLL